MSQVDPKSKLVTLCVKLAKIGVKDARAPPLAQTRTGAAVSRDELDTRVFQRVLDLGEDLNGPSDRAIAAFHALYGGQVNIGLFGKLDRGPAQERMRRANLI